MRLLIDTLIALMLAGILAAVLWQYRKDGRQVHQVQAVHQSLARLQEQMLYRGALGEAATGPAGFPLEVSPLWFPDGLPFNNLVPGRQPWLDVAPENDPGENPPDPILRRPGQAGFWYNPNRGVFRARVIPQFTLGATVELYNNVNGTSLSTLDERQAVLGDGILKRAGLPGAAPAVTPPTSEPESAPELAAAPDSKATATPELEPAIAPSAAPAVAPSAAPAPTPKAPPAPLALPAPTPGRASLRDQDHH
ncbi:MAG: hypothetical protein NTW19_18420 [Planctomycetota bacterium]|nr:hypothetical protein [Planctomycetota bacterium]